MTGHTGFKGAWLALWLTAWAPRYAATRCRRATEPNLFRRAGSTARSIASSAISAIWPRSTLPCGGFEPEMVLHLAAQALVRPQLRAARRNLRDQRDGHGARAGGRARHAHRSARSSSSPATSATRTANGPGPIAKTTPWAATIPTAAARAAPSWSTAAYRRSFFHGRAPARPSPPPAPATSSAAATGPRTALCPTSFAPSAAGRGSRVRNPGAVRPWQHVLEPLAGYLLLAQKAVRWARRSRAVEFRSHPRRGADRGRRC